MTGASAAGTEPSSEAPRRRLTQRVPALYPVAVEVLRLRRRWAWLRDPTPLARTTSGENLPVRVTSHRSLLLRTLGDSEMWMQHNKVQNLRIVADRLDGLLIRPDEQFSFCRLVGKATRRKGYLDGMLLSNGAPTAGVGGGICQMANLLHWMVLHTPLTVVERSEHSYDPFPDNGRVLPWGVGCAVYYNYVDLRLRNDTEITLQLRTRVGDRYLEGEIRSEQGLPWSYSVYAVDERFEQRGPDWFRHNEIWRDVIDRRTGNRVDRELVKVNPALVKYVPGAAQRRGEVT